MYHLTLEQLFGQGAIQDSTFLIIQKNALIRLTPNSSNTGESLLTAILITALLNFQGVITDENNQPITDENNRSISFDNSDSFELIKMFLWKPYQLIRNNQKHINNQIIVESYAKYDSD